MYRSNQLAFQALVRGFALLALGATCMHLVLAQNTTATEVVRSTVTSVLDALRDESLTEVAKKNQVAAIVDQHFDFGAMASRVLATNWKRASSTQQQQITRLFRQMLVETYWQKMAAFSGESVEFIAELARSEQYVSCKTMVKSKSADIPVDYKLYRVNSTWMAYDVVIEQVSLVRNYRGKFQSIVRDGGIDGLIAHLESSAP
ncbi:MAG: MlaC/ttg2D family ABC transporter substrate-binding protein [Gammaproteobacteria bacterium]